MRNKTKLCSLFFLSVFLPAFLFSCDGSEPDSSDGVPQIETLEISNITSTSASSGGKNIRSEDSAIEEKGVCWSTEGEPTIDDFKTTDGSGIEDFVSELTELIENTTYYVRAYASNEFGTGYGKVVSFKTEEVKIVYGSNVNDIDGNVYRTVVIGTQTWMVENLKVTKYNDGSAILTTTTDSEWTKFTTGAFCWYNNDANYKATYGALYNWYAVNSGKLCPAGWHVPTNQDWETLSAYLGGAYLAGGKLKEAGTTHWRDPNLASAETGFNALPGGTRNYFGTYDALGRIAHFWSSTPAEGNNAHYFQMTNEHTGLTTYQLHKATGFSVRCVKN